MNRSECITTTDLNLAAALMTATNTHPVKIYPGNDFVAFDFQSNERTEAVMVKYAAGTLVLNVRRLGRCRLWLDRKCRVVASNGIEVMYEQ